MASPKSYFARTSYRFLPTDHHHASGGAGAVDSMILELDESDVWNASSAPRSRSPDLRKASSRMSRKPSSVAVRGGEGPASLPVNVPDWSKILKHEYRENRRTESSDGEDEYEGEERGNRIPPHEFLARQVARSRIASSSVHEGIGRTLKGRDLSRVRNAIWQKTGFED